MSYTKTQWVNDEAPAIDADNLNKIEQGIFDAHDKLDGITDVVAELGAHNLVNITIQSQTIGGITVTNNGDGTVDIGGANTSGNDLYIKLCDIVIEPGYYFLSGCPEDGSVDFNLQFQSIQPYIAPIQDKGTGTSFDTRGQAKQTVPLYIFVKDNLAVFTCTFKPMVSYYYASREFHPYAMTNKKLTEKIDKALMLDNSGNLYVKSPNSISAWEVGGCDGVASTKPKITGYTCLTLGNNIPSDTDGYRQGEIQLFSYGTKSVTLMTASNITDWRIIRLPDADGTMALLDDIEKRTFKYSTTEKVIGTWIDGKPLYRKTFSLSSLNCVANDWTQTSIPRGSMEMLIDISVLIESSTPSVHKGLSGGFIDNYVAINSFRTFGTDTGDVAYVTIQYTKNTD